MKCPTCVEEGNKSIVSVGGSITTAMASHQFYDENGKYHLHDPNTSSTQYRCSNGHDWTESSKNKCWCEQ